ncbi:MAG: hypothetical protein ABR562_03530 [Thermoplasmatota archaeon]
MAELTGIRSGDGAKMKAEVGEDHVAFRGAVKADVPFEEIVAEARGTLLVLSFRGTTVELGAGARAAQLASRIRSPPSRLDRLGVPAGASTAAAGPLDAGLRSELASRTHMAAGVPRDPVDHLFFAVDAAEALLAVPKLVPLVAPGGTLWVVSDPARVPAAKVGSAARAAGLQERRSVRLPPSVAVAFSR